MKRQLTRGAYAKPNSFSASHVLFERLAFEATPEALTHDVKAEEGEVERQTVPCEAAPEPEEEIVVEEPEKYERYDENPDAFSYITEVVEELEEPDL